MKRLIITIAALALLSTNAHACDPSHLAEIAAKYNKVCSKLPADYLNAVYRAARLSPDQALADALKDDSYSDSSYSNSGFCGNNAGQIAESIAYFKKHRSDRCF